MNEYNAKEEILKLRDGESWVWPESDYGKAEIWFKYGNYFIFGIPMFGGTPQFEKALGWHMIDEVVRVVGSWT